jgi:hypothetical protein
MPAHLSREVDTIEGEVESKISLPGARLVPCLENGDKNIKAV